MTPQNFTANPQDSVDAGFTASPADQSSISKLDRHAAVLEDETQPEVDPRRGDLEEPKGISKSRLYVRRFMRNKSAIFGLGILVSLILISVFGGYFVKYSWTDLDFLALSQPPSFEHPFGTNEGGGDLLAQVIHGLGRSLTIAIVVSTATTIISALVGSAAAFFGGRIEKITLAVIHFLLIIPSFLILALGVSHAGGDWKVLIVALIAFGWMYYSRLIWSLAMSIREREFIQAARFMGISSFKIIVRHMIPNIGSLLIINLTLGVVSTVMSETGLSFLGLGVKIPDVSLGTLLQGGSAALNSAPWLFIFPAGVLTLLTVSMALISDGLRDALDPNSAAGGKA